MHVTITTVKHSSGHSWLETHIPPGEFAVTSFPAHTRIEQLAAETQAMGPQPLWSGYQGAYAGTKRANAGEVRTSNEVRTRASTGLFYYALVRKLRPSVIVEIGTAFGVSGMYWLAALEDNQSGHLYTFDPNETWRTIALGNLENIGTRFTSVLGTFEEFYRDALPHGGSIDLAFVDGIHTSAFVEPQVSLIRERMSAGGLLILDDIRFSKDMFACWSRLAHGATVRASIEVGGRVGILEYATL